MKKENSIKTLMHMHTYMFTDTHVCCIYIYIHMHNIRIYVYTHVYMYIYNRWIYIHTHVYIYIYICVCVSRAFPELFPTIPTDTWHLARISTVRSAALPASALQCALSAAVSPAWMRQSFCRQVSRSLSDGSWFFSGPFRNRFICGNYHI